MDIKQKEREIFSKNLRHYLSINNKTQSDLSRDLKITTSTISDWVNAKKYPRMDKVQLLADYLGIKKSDLVENKPSNLSTPHPVSFITIPLYGDISCGNGMFVDDNLVYTIEVVSNGLAGSESDYFAQIASGDSMINAGINDGDLLIFKKSSSIESGQIGSFCIDDGIATCKKFRQGETFIQLIPMNPSYDPIVIDLNSTNFRVIGILKRAIKEF